MHRQGSEGGTKWRQGGRDERGVEAEREGGKEAGRQRWKGHGGREEAGKQAERERRRILGRVKCNIGPAEQLTPFQYIDSGKIKEIAKETLNKGIFVIVHLFFEVPDAYLPSFLSSAEKYFCYHAWNSVHTCASERSHPELNINLSLFYHLFQVQCNMEHEWLPEESLAGTLANLFFCDQPLQLL